MLTFYSAKDSLEFVIQWLERFPRYKNRELYITGESYAGHYVPQLAKEIMTYNIKAKQRINLKGIMVNIYIHSTFFLPLIDLYINGNWLWQLGYPCFQSLSVLVIRRFQSYSSQNLVFNFIFIIQNIWALNLNSLIIIFKRQILILLVFMTRMVIKHFTSLSLHSLILSLRVTKINGSNLAFTNVLKMCLRIN